MGGREKEEGSEEWRKEEGGRKRMEPSDTVQHLDKKPALRKLSTLSAGRAEGTRALRIPGM